MDIALNYGTNLEREEAMYEGGRLRHLKNEERAIENGEVSQAGRRLIDSAMPKTLEAMRNELASAPRQKPAYFPALEMIELDVLAMLLLTHMTRRAALANTDDPARASMSDLYTALGFDVRQMVAEAAWQKEDSKEYKAALKALPRSKQERMIAGMEAQKRFPIFGEEADINAGFAAGLVMMVMAATDMFATFEHKGEEDKWPTLCLTFSEVAAEFIGSTTEAIQYDHPEFGAMLVPPAKWDSFDRGAYLDPRVARKNPLINHANKAQREAINAAIAADAPFIRALNAIQEVPFQINRFVFNLVKHCNRKKIEIGKDGDVMPGTPRSIDWNSEDKKKCAADYRFNKAVTAKRIAINSALAAAEELVNEPEFYQPHYLDFRARVYARPSFNHQRSDYCKAMFNLARGEVLTEDGLWWLKWHVATTGGFKVKGVGMDKAPREQRVQWTDDNMDLIRSVVAAPKSTVDVWSMADSPFCFMAAAEALVEALKAPTTYVCRIPVAIDGSCSGLQHFSAILRDEEGGKHVNLIPSETPKDVYKAVAQISAAVVAKDFGDVEVGSIAELWSTYKDNGIDRSITKRNTMTYGYGSEAGGMSKQLWEDELRSESAKKHFGDDATIRRAACAYLAKINFAAIKETVPGAEACKTFFRAISKELSDANLPSCWVSPTGFPVISTYYEATYKQVTTMVWDSELRVPKKYKPKLFEAYTKQINKNEQKTGISPNFIHSLDAAHLHSVVLKSVEEGITDFLLIHDSFASTPNNMARFSKIVRETFVEMYEANDPLQDLLDGAKRALTAKMGAESPDAAQDTLALLKNLEVIQVPARGNLDLKVVLDSEYCFS
jgi:DNA-directed RNA polymerase